MPDWIRDHLSFIRVDSRERSLGDMSGLIQKGCRSDRLLERILDTSADLMNLTKMGLGQHCCIWLEFLNFPRRKWSLHDGLRLNRAVCVNTGDDSHYVLKVHVETFVFGSAF